jgi:uncharacterized protein (TIGR00297 family)
MDGFFFLNGASIFNESIELLIVVILTLAISSLSFRKKSLDFNGILYASLFGIVTYFLGGFTTFLVILLFFAVAELSTRYARTIKTTAKPHETRTMGNILGNAGAGLIALGLNPVQFNIAFFGAMSAALADTLSSEIGLLSKTKPVLITTLKKVTPGTDGGITFLGLIAAIAGATVIGIVYWYWTQDITIAIILVIAGVFGSLVDSLLGAVLESKKILNNTSVNFLASASGALLASFLVTLI